MNEGTIAKQKDFLLRCANTYNWEILVDFCKLLLNVLTSPPIPLPLSSDTDGSDHDDEDPQPNDSATISHYAASYFLYQERMLTLAAAKEQLTRTDEWGNNCLHAACYNTPPLEVVTSILRCAAAASVPIHKMVSRDLSTPLSIACATGASVDVIRALLHPSWAISNSCDGSGTFCDVKGVLEDAGALVSMMDAQGCTPLSELTIHYELKRKAPWYSRTAKPLDEVLWTGRDHRSHPKISVESHRSNATKTHRVPDDDQPLFESFWIKVEMLLRAAWVAGHGGSCAKGEKYALTHPPRPWISILHGAAFVSETCPEVLTSLICRSVASIGTVGRAIIPESTVMPLHLAVTGCRPHVGDQQSRKEVSGQLISRLRRRDHMIKSLLHLNPTEAKVAFPNGRSVLCQAIASGLQWNTWENVTQCEEGTVPLLSGTSTSCNHESGNVTSMNTKQNESTRGSLYFIWKAYPDALWCRDSQSGLFPFMLAACSMSCNSTGFGSTRSHSRTINHFERCQLDTIFELLRLHPDVTLSNRQYFA